MFREAFKYYKRKVPPPDLTNVLDLSQEKTDFSQVTVRGPYDFSSNNNETYLEDLGLKQINEWKIYELNSHPGLIYILNPFENYGQQLWICRALSVYTKFPNKLNLYAHGDLTSDEDWWSVCHNSPERKINLYKKLRWVTLGYHHNWDTKVYNDLEKSEFPDELKSLSQIVVKAACNYYLEPQAAIINYYNIGSTLSGHTDHSEPNHLAPLVSFSFGQESIFLIGGRSIEDNCTALVVKSGDIMIMSGDSRLCYHGVPLVRQTQDKPWECNTSTDLLHSWSPFEDYITTSRININVRQVLHSGQVHLGD